MPQNGPLVESMHPAQAQAAGEPQVREPQVREPQWARGPQVREPQWARGLRGPMGRALVQFGRVQALI